MIHHPEMDENQIKDAATSLLKGAPPGSNYILHAFSGVSVNTCESSFYTLFYIDLGSRCKTLLFFLVAMETLKKQSHLWMKIKELLQFIMVHKKKPTVPWLNNITLNLLESRVEEEAMFIEMNGDTSNPLGERNDSLESIFDGMPSRKQKLGENNSCQKKKRFLNGITNKGNMCYMIVIVQMMYPMRVIRDACSMDSNSNKGLLSSPYGDTEMDRLREFSLILDNLQDVFTSLDSINASVSISNFKKLLTSTRIFKDHRQTKYRRCGHRECIRTLMLNQSYMLICPMHYIAT